LEAKAALREAIQVLESPETEARVAEAAQTLPQTTGSGSEFLGLQLKAGSNRTMDLIKEFHVSFPVKSEILSQVVSVYGFPENGEGVVQFTLAVKELERHDPEVGPLLARMRSLLLPQRPEEPLPC
jgi:hypothetical protein